MFCTCSNLKRQTGTLTEKCTCNVHSHGATDTALGVCHQCRRQFLEYVSHFCSTNVTSWKRKVKLPIASIAVSRKLPSSEKLYRHQTLDCITVVRCNTIAIYGLSRALWFNLSCLPTCSQPSCTIIPSHDSHTSCFLSSFTFGPKLVSSNTDAQVDEQVYVITGLYNVLGIGPFLSFRHSQRCPK